MAVIDTVRAAQRNHSYGITVELKVRECPTCGIVYGVPADFYDACYRKGERFFCPNGHSLGWNETEADRERKRRQQAERDAEALKRDRDWYREQRDAARQLAEHERRSAIAYKGHLTRIRRRIANGVCPVPGCKRSGFQRVMAHIASQHPDWLHDHAHELDGGDA